MMLDSLFVSFDLLSLISFDLISTLLLDVSTLILQPLLCQEIASKNLSLSTPVVFGTDHGLRIDCRLQMPSIVC